MKTRILLIGDEPRWTDLAKNDLSKSEIVVASNMETVLAELEAGRSGLVIASSCCRRSWIGPVTNAKE